MKTVTKAYKQNCKNVSDFEIGVLGEAVASMTRSDIDTHAKRLFRAQNEFSKCKDHSEGLRDTYMHAIMKAARGEDMRLDSLQEYATAMRIVNRILDKQDAAEKKRMKRKLERCKC